MTRTKEDEPGDRRCARIGTAGHFSAPSNLSLSDAESPRSRMLKSDSLDGKHLDARLLDALCLATQALAEAYARSQRSPDPGDTEVAVPTSAIENTPRSARRRRNRPVEAHAPSPGETRRSLNHRTGETLFVYCAGSPGLQQIALERRLPLFKLGSTRGSVSTRLTELSAIGYAARADPSGDDAPGFDAWTNVRIVARPSPNRAIAIHRGFIEVQLPAVLSAPAFEARLREALAPLALERAIVDLDVERSAARWTRQRYPAVVPARATELYLFRPREDGDRLVSLIEGILEQARGSCGPAPRELYRLRSTYGHQRSHPTP